MGHLLVIRFMFVFIIVEAANTDLDLSLLRLFSNLDCKITDATISTGIIATKRFRKALHSGEGHGHVSAR